MLLSPAGRDDADNFFAIGSLPISVKYGVDGKPADPPYSVPSRFARFPVVAVWDDQATSIGRNARGKLKPDAAVFSPVQPVLVPFETHRVYT
jgi:hypothetical protein